MGYKAVSSSTVTTRNKKIVHWGGTGTRKTESILRNYPDVLLIDVEGNADQCIGMKEIPEFILVKTKDVYEILDVLDDVISGKLKFPDGRKIQTVGIDGMSVLWSVRQEVASDAAETRVGKYAKGPVNPDALDISMREWNIAKRPMKRLSTWLANAPVKYIVLTAREKPLTIPRPGSTRADDVITVGTTMEAMKGLDYEANVALHFYNDDKVEGAKLVKGPWMCEVSKVQGSLGSVMPIGKTFSAYPFSLIVEHSKLVKPSVGTDVTEMDAAKASAVRDTAEGKAPAAPKVAPKADLKPAAPIGTLAAGEYSKSDLTAYAGKCHVSIAALKPALDAAGLSTVNWDPQKKAQYEAVVDRLAQAPIETPAEVPA